MEPISTGIFKIKGGAISRTMMMLYGKSWILGTLSLMLPFVVAGILFEFRWIILALMLLFIIMPMLLAFLYFYYGLNPISVINSTHHKFEFGTQGMKAYLYSEEVPKQISASPSDPISSLKEKPNYKLRSQIDIPYSNISDFIVGMADVILRTNFNGNGFLLLPLSSFQDSQLFTETIDIVTNGLKKNNNKTTHENTKRQ